MPCSTCGRYHEGTEPCEPSSLERYLSACQDAIEAWDEAELMLTDAVWWGQRGRYNSMMVSSRMAGAAQARARQALWTAEHVL